ncbi:cell-cycle control medial ring component [Podospora conica]|nr:cell-cycle control medial ring component [Schizothecium conicum]
MASSTEIAFAKSFLSLLDSKPTKIAPDHIEDPHNYPPSSPYTLPRLPSQRPPARRPRNPSGLGSASTPAPGSDPSIPIRIRSLRNPPLDLTLPALPLATTSALDVKLAVAAATSIPVDKIKLLLNKKPVPDTRSLKEMVASSSASTPSGAAGAGLELGVMVMGGWSAPVAPVAAAPVVEKKEEEGEGAKVAQGLSGRGVLETEAFWGDLKGFLEQRVRDEGVATEAVERFRGAWEAGRGV